MNVFTGVIISLTGTPGTGKTTVGALLQQKGLQTIELGDLIKEKKLYDSYDVERGSYDVDPEVLNEYLQSLNIKEDCVLIGHLSHLVSCDVIIVLRCHPSKLADRLKCRNWPEPKIRENAGAESLDVILVESIESELKVYEIDTTEKTAEEVCEAVFKIKNGDVGEYTPGKIDWSEEVLEWC